MGGERWQEEAGERERKHRENLETPSIQVRKNLKRGDNKKLDEEPQRRINKGAINVTCTGQQDDNKSLLRLFELI